MEVLYEDKQIIVCVKPIGVDSEKEMPALLGDEIYTIHRLDKNVGGVMVYAKTRQTAAALSKAIQNGEMIKEYVAMVHGVPPESGDWEDFLFKDSSKNKVFVVKKERRGVKKAKLSIQRLTNSSPALVQVRLYTGRTHQIRVQFASRGYPLVGDRKYGAKDTWDAPMLFSFRLTFPYDGKTVFFEKFPDWA